MKKLIVYMLAVMAMTSCESIDENGRSENNLASQEITLKASVTPMALSSKAAITGSTFTDGTVIGLFGVKENDWETPFFNNLGATIQSDGVKFANNMILYYPQDNNTVTFYAYYPKEANEAGLVTDANKIPSVTYSMTDQNDILWAKVTTGTVENHGEEKLEFSHKLAKINFKVKAGNGFTSGITVTSIKIAGANSVAVLNVSTGELSFTTPVVLDAYSGTPVSISSTLSDAFGEMLLQPAATYTLNVIAGGVTYEAELTTPNAGQAQTMTLTFQATGIETKASIVPWDTIEDGNINLQKR